ncbi:branched-chain amino acid ABC transporter permease [Caldinitratiruptor microaerophilus]|uniref:ABC transporter n=1 Tax=Caldinitratiruptor microaerophilus TaxID=671077 RepID=A0AA35CN79_9FIRM|nr:branched-chain amino acid ABC transporter permease [Caldinitratiruptor microaerophilus]BDG62415.1 ABC transporter [Caldinitratiruptor microaerophilus]
MAARWQSLFLWTLATALAVALHLLGRAGVLSGYTVQVLSLICINIILTASLNLVNGYLGEFAIGHAGFMAVGAYVAGVMTVKLDLPFWLAFVAAGLAAALAAWLVGIPAFTTFGDYLAIITLGFNMIIVNVITNIDAVGGPRGMAGLPKATNLLWVYGTVAATLIVLGNLVRSNYGRLWTAIRQNEIAATLMGARVKQLKLTAFVVAGLFAGLAGALWGHLIQYINPSSFTYIKSTEILVMLYLGGMGSLSGSVVGATLMTVLLESLRGLGVWRLVISPLILIVIMLRMPRGILGFRELSLGGLFRPRGVSRRAAA